MEFEQQFRDEMFGDLPVIKFILDASPKGRITDGGIPLGEWGGILLRWLKKNGNQMTRKEHAKLLRECAILNERMAAVHTFMREHEHIELEGGQDG